MIAKHVAMTTAAKSNFSGLVKYLTASQGKLERVGIAHVSNCQSDDPEIAIIEALNTQAQNKRATADKTYHLIVSFRAGELPDEAVLKAIEERICDGLGFTGHQRVRVVHSDTDNLHMHIAINKIHPQRYTIHEPFNAYHTLSQLCDKLENEYGLEKDNHKAAKVGSENRAADMERHADVQSLLGWIKRECKDRIETTRSWSEMHELMREHGLHIHERANGLVITAANGTSVKASSVAREFSKTRLEARLGVFAPSSAHFESAKPVKRYDKQPMRSRIDTVELYARYKHAQQQTTSYREIEWSKSRARKDRLIEDAKRIGRLKKAAIKLVQAPRLAKRLMYATTGHTLREDIAAINRQYIKERQDIYQKYQRNAWADWLQSQAETGDAQALAALRSRQSVTGLKGNTVTGQGRDRHDTAAAKPDSITKKGTIIFSMGANAVRDDGDKLMVSRGSDQAGLVVALRMAIERYGSAITVNGTAAFKEQIARAAVAANLFIKFDEDALERRRQELANAVTTRENKHGNTGSNDSDAVKRRPDRSRDGRGQQAAAGTRRSAQGPKSDPRSARQTTPPSPRHGVRGLSELGVVHVTHGGEVLLPGHVPGHVERQGTQPDHGVRRPFPRLRQLKTDRAEPPASAEKPPQSQKIALNAEGHKARKAANIINKTKVPRVGSAPPPASKNRLRRLSQLGAAPIGLGRPDTIYASPVRVTSPTTSTISKPAERVLSALKPPAIAAAQKYIIEREQKRSIGFDIPKHKPFTLIDDVTADYAGTRVIEGQALALLKVGEDVMVLPVDDATARRLKRITLGRPLEVSAKGAIKSKGRSR